MEIKDVSGNLVRTFSSLKDSNYRRYDGAPPADPVLSKSKGLNRFVWNMRYPSIPGIPDVYFDGTLHGHKAIPGTYTVTLKMGSQQLSTQAQILSNPLYPTDATTYQEYNTVMTNLEKELTVMHNMVNKMDAKRQQLEKLVASLTGDKYASLKTEAAALAKR